MGYDLHKDLKKARAEQQTPTDNSQRWKVSSDSRPINDFFESSLMKEENMFAACSVIGGYINRLFVFVFIGFFRFQ